MSDALESFKMEMDGPHVKRISIAGKEIPLALLAEVWIQFAPGGRPQAVLTYDPVTVEIKNVQGKEVVPTSPAQG